MKCHSCVKKNRIFCVLVNSIVTFVTFLLLVVSVYADNSHPRYVYIKNHTCDYLVVTRQGHELTPNGSKYSFSWSDLKGSFSIYLKERMLKNKAGITIKTAVSDITDSWI